MTLNAKTFDEQGREVVSPEEWRKAHAQGYARIWDGRRYMLRLDRETGATVWREVVGPKRPLIEHKRREP